MNERNIFVAALQRQNAAERSEFLDAACGADAQLRQQVEMLLREHEQLGSFLEAPASPAASPDRPLPEKPDTRIGPYKLLEEIGAGGFGVVFMAEQLEPVRRKVALKVIKPGMDSRQVIARFEAERQALALMDHPNIARILDAGTIPGVRGQESGVRGQESGVSKPGALGVCLTSDPCLLTSDPCLLTSDPCLLTPDPCLLTPADRPFFVMELVKGLPITDFCDQGRLTPRERLELFSQVCRAVQHAHQRGIIHRDIKPSNVLVTLHDGTPLVKVIDFGIAKALGRTLTDGTLFTGFAQMLGTPLYMSPEQAALSDIDVDTRSDIYSLGVLLYELLTGTTPFAKERFREAGYDEMRRVIREEEPPRPSTRLTTLGQAATTVSAQPRSDPKTLCILLRGELDWIVMRALEKDRNRRYESASALAADVQRYLQDEPVEACPPSRRYRLGKFLRKHRHGVLMATALTAALGVLGAGIGWVALDQAARRTEVESQRVALEQAVAKDLEQAEFWQINNQSAKALQFLQLAKGRLAESGLAALRVRVEARRREVALVARLQQARLKGSLTSTGLGLREGDRLYGAAFVEQGLGVAAADIEETARQIQASAIRHQLVSALDDWAFLKDGLEAGTGEPLRAIVRLADNDPWRRQVRNHWKAKDREALMRLAEREDVLNQPPGNLLLLHDVLGRVPWPLDMEVGARFEAGKKLGAIQMRLLRQAALRYPADFWINWISAVALSFEALDDVTNAAEAIGFLRAALALQPDYPELHHELGILLHIQKNLADAVLAYQKTIELQPDFYDAYRELGAILREQLRLPEAEAVYRKVAALQPDNASTYLALAGALMDQQKLPEAIENYRKAIDINPQGARGHYLLGGALQKQGNLPDAEAAYRNAVKISPRYQEVYGNLGDVLSLQNKTPEAEATFRKAIELMFERQQLHEERKHVAAHAAALKELETHLARAHNGLGITLARQERLPEAIQAWRKAIGFNPGLVEAHLNLGKAYEHLGEFSESLSALEQALELGAGPKSKVLAEALRKVEQLARLDAKLPKIMIGETQPADAAELVGLATLCQLQCRQLNAAATRFYGEAFAAEPRLADDLSSSNRYNAACAAALAGCGQGKDTANLEPEEYARLRGQALAWLRLDLSAWRLTLEKDTNNGYRTVLQTMPHWQQDLDFNGVRGEPALAKLPEGERQDWQKLWEGVEELRKRAAGSK